MEAGAELGRRLKTYALEAGPAPGALESGSWSTPPRPPTAELASPPLGGEGWGARPCEARHSLCPAPRNFKAVLPGRGLYPLSASPFLKHGVLSGLAKGPVTSAVWHVGCRARGAGSHLCPALPGAASLVLPGPLGSSCAPSL